MLNKISQIGSIETITSENVWNNERSSREQESKISQCWLIFTKILKRIWIAMKNTFAEFCSYSSIHGLNHNHNPLWYEKMVFNIFTVLAVIACCLIMRLVRYEQLESPIIMNYVQKEMTIDEIPFPAITICSQVKASYKKINYSVQEADLYLIRDHELKDKITAISKSFCSRGITQIAHGYNPLDKLLTKSIAQNLKEVALEVDDIISDCETHNFGSSCHWTRIMNSQGVCYTMNLIDSTELFHHDVAHQYESHKKLINGWSIEEKKFIQQNKQNEYYPATANFTETSNVVLTLKYNVNDAVNICYDIKGVNAVDGLDGFNIYIHSPFEYPWRDDQFQKVSPNMDVKFNIIPEMTIADNNLKSTNVARRKCIFQEESNLTYFKQYTKNNCELECTSKQSQKICLCTEFWLPANLSNNNMCGNGTDSQSHCWMNGLPNILTYDKIRLSLYGDSVCRCWPPCNELTYEVERVILSQNYTEMDHDDFRFTRLEFRFKNFGFKPLKREKLYTDLDYIADIGNLLSLFIGSSVLSLFELIYSCTFGFIKHLLQKSVTVRVDFAEENV